MPPRKSLAQMLSAVTKAETYTAASFVPAGAGDEARGHPSASSRGGDHAPPPPTAASSASPNPNKGGTTAAPRSFSETVDSFDGAAAAGASPPPAAAAAVSAQPNAADGGADNAPPTKRTSALFSFIRSSILSPVHPPQALQQQQQQQQPGAVRTFPTPQNSQQLLAATASGAPSRNVSSMSFAAGGGDGTGFTPLPGATPWGAETLLAEQQRQRGDNSLHSIMTIVVAILVVLLIVTLMRQTWVLVEPYSLPLCGAIVLSVALHENPEHEPSQGPTDLARLKAQFSSDHPRLSFLAPCCAVTRFFYVALQKVADRTGVDKYPIFMLMPVHVRNLVMAAAVVALVARLGSFIVPQFLIGMLFSALLLLALPALIGLVLCWFLEERRFLRVMRVIFSGLMITVIGTTFTICVVTEVQKSGQNTVKFVRSYGMQVPDNAPSMVTSYFLSKNVTDVLIPALQKVQFNGTWTDIYQNAVAFATNHTTTLTAALSETQPAAQGVTTVVSNVLQFVVAALLWSVGKIYELILFYVTLQTLLSLERTVLYYLLLKVLGVVLGDEKRAHEKAERTETRMISELSTLFYSLWHVFVFHFLLTLVWYSAFHMPLSVCVSTIGGVLALFPLSLPPMITQIIFALVVNGINGRIDFVMLAVGGLFYLVTLSVNLIEVSSSVVGGRNESKKEKTVKGKKGGKLQQQQLQESAASPSRGGQFAAAVASVVASGAAIADGASAAAAAAAAPQLTTAELAEQKANSYLVTTSIILGLSAHGAIGVVIGPIVVIATHALYDSFGSF